METTKIIESTAPVTEEVITIGEGELLMATETVTEARDYWTPENLMGDQGTVPILGKGMLGIFIVMGIIILCVSLLNHFGSPDRKAKKEAKKAAKAQANTAQQNK